MSETSPIAQEEFTLIYDDATIPIESQTEVMVSEDVVSETVVVTTTPHVRDTTDHVANEEALSILDDDATIPIESQTKVMVSEDVVSETVVVTTSPHVRATTDNVANEEALSILDDDATIPIESQTEVMVSEDVVSETVVVTTSPHVRATTDQVANEEALSLSNVLDDAERITTLNDGMSLLTGDVTALNNRGSSAFDIVTTLHHLSSRNLRSRSSVLEDFTRLRDRLKKREQRKNPEYRQKETAKARVRMANRRSDPILRAIERERDRERRAKARQREEVRDKERKRDKIYKKNLRQRSHDIDESDETVDKAVANIPVGRQETIEEPSIIDDRYTHLPVSSETYIVKELNGIGSDSHSLTKLPKDRHCIGVIDDRTTNLPVSGENDVVCDRTSNLPVHCENDNVKDLNVIGPEIPSLTKLPKGGISSIKTKLRHIPDLNENEQEIAAIKRFSDINTINGRKVDAISEADHNVASNTVVIATENNGSLLTELCNPFNSLINTTRTHCDTTMTHCDATRTHCDATRTHCDTVTINRPNLDSGKLDRIQEHEEAVRIVNENGDEIVIFS